MCFNISASQRCYNQSDAATETMDPGVNVDAYHEIAAMSHAGGSGVYQELSAASRTGRNDAYQEINAMPRTRGNGEYIQVNY